MKAKPCAFCGAADSSFGTICQKCFHKSGKQNARQLLRRVNKMAEADIIKGNPITGAHHRAIEKLLKELK